MIRSALERFCILIACICTLTGTPCAAAENQEPELTGLTDGGFPVLATYRTSSDYSPVYKPLYSLLIGEGPLHSAYLPGGKEPLQEFAFHTALEDAPHIIIDMRDIRVIGGLRIENRRRQFQERARGLTVWLSGDGVSWRAVASLPDSKPVWTVRFESSWQARYIKIGLQRRDYLHLARVELLGYPPDSPPEQLPDGDRSPAGPMKQIVGPGTAVQRIEFAGLLTVEIPPGTVTAPEELVVIPDPELPAEGAGDLETLAAFDISLGSRHEFDRALVLEVPYRPEWFDSAEAMQREVVAARWDDQEQVWIALPLEVDADRRILRVTTRHLSIFGWFYRIRAWGYRAVIADNWYTVFHTRYFALYLDENALGASQKIRNWTSKTPDSACKPPLDPPGRIHEPDRPRIEWPGWKAVSRISGRRMEQARPFINSIVWFLTSSFHSYEKAGFDLPLKKMPISVFLTTGGSADVPASYCTETGALMLSAHPKRSADSTDAGFLHTIAHEVFHVFQGAPLSYNAEKMTNKEALWWIESTAEYVACSIVSGYDLAGNPTAETLPDIRNRIGGGGPFAVWPYLAEYPIVYSGHAKEYDPAKDQGNNLEYDRAWMLHYLMTQITPPVTRNKQPMTQSKPLFADVFKATQQAYHTAETPFPAFRQECSKRGKPPTDLQREFAAWFILGINSPVARIQPASGTRPNIGPGGIPLLATVNKNNGRPEICKPGTAGELLRHFSLKPGYTSQAWAVKAARPADGKPVTLEVRAEAVPPDAYIDVFVCPGNNRLPGLPPKASGSLTQAGQRTNITVAFGQDDDLEVGINNAQVFCDDVVYVIMTNAHETQTADVSVRVSQVSPPTPTPKPPASGPTPATGAPAGDPGTVSWVWYNIDTVIYRSQDYNMADYSRQSGSAGDGSVCSREDWQLGDTKGTYAGCMTWSFSAGLDVLEPRSTLQAEAKIQDQAGQGQVTGWVAFQSPETGWEMYDTRYGCLVEVVAASGRDTHRNEQKIPAGIAAGDTILLRARITAGRSSITYDRVYQWRQRGSNRETTDRPNAGIGFEGRWNTPWGVVEFKTDGAAIVGTYPHKDGKIRGQLTANGTRLIGTWSQNPDHKSPDNAGAVEFKLLPDAQGFTGVWWYGDKPDDGSGGTAWNGTRVPL